MRRLLLVASALVAIPFAAAAEEPRITLRGGYDGVQVFRGSQLAEDTISSSIELSIPQRSREFYLGGAVSVPVDQPSGAFDFEEEFRLFAGGAFNWWDGVWLDVGYTQFLYGENGPGLFHNGMDRGQLHFGGFIDLELLDRDFEPSAFFFYDLEREELVFEIDLRYSHLVGPNLYVDIGGHAGASMFAEGRERVVVGGALITAPIEEYAYFGLNADLRFDLSGRAEAFAGGRIAGASEDRFIDGYSPATGLPAAFDASTAWMAAGLRVDF